MIVGVDFGAPQRTRDQRRKIIAVAAHSTGWHSYRIDATGMNARLLAGESPGWTAKELVEEPVARPARVVGFDFQFCVPHALLRDPKFAYCASTSAARMPASRMAADAARSGVARASWSADEKTKERCTFSPAHLHASPLRQAFDQDIKAELHLGRECFASRTGMPRNLGGESSRWAPGRRRIAMLSAQVGADGEFEVSSEKCL